MRGSGSLRRVRVQSITKILVLALLAPLLLLTPTIVHAVATAINLNGTFQVDTNTSSYISNPLIARYDVWGDTYLAASVDGSARLVSPGGPRTVTSTGDGSTLVARYDSAGNVTWQSITQPDSESYSYPTAIAIDSEGSMIVTGVWTGSVTFDGVGGADTRDNGHTSSSTVRDTYVTKYTADREYLWTVTTDTPGGDRWATSTSLAIDSNDNIFIGGMFVGEVTFDGVGGTHSLNGGNNTNGYLMKIASNGDYQYTYTPDNSNPADGDPGLSTSVYVNDVAIDTNDDVYLTGQYMDTVTFADDSSFTVNGMLPFVTKLSNNGDYQRTTVFSNATPDPAFVTAYNMAISSDGSLYLMGYASGGSFLIDETHSVTMDTEGAVLFKLQNDGNAIWWRVLGVGEDPDASIVIPEDIALDQADNAYVVGTYGGIGTIYFDPTCANLSFDAPVSSENYFLTAYSAAGNHAFTAVGGIVDDNSWAEGYSVATDSTSVTIAGLYHGNMLMDGPGGHFNEHPYFTNGSSLFVNSYHIALGDDEVACEPPVKEEPTDSGTPGNNPSSRPIPPTQARINTYLPSTTDGTDDTETTPTPTETFLGPKTTSQPAVDEPVAEPNYTWVLWLVGLGVPAAVIAILLVRAGVRARTP